VTIPKDVVDRLCWFGVRRASGDDTGSDKNCGNRDHRRRHSHPQFDFASVRLIRNRIWSPPNRSEIEFRLFQIDPSTLETTRGRQKSRVEILMSKPPHDKITQIGCSDEGRLWWRDFAGRMICWGDGTHGRGWKWTWYQASGMLTTSACGWIVLVSSSARTRLCRADRRGPSDDRHRTSDEPSRHPRRAVTGDSDDRSSRHTRRAVGAHPTSVAAHLTIAAAPSTSQPATSDVRRSTFDESSQLTRTVVACSTTDEPSRHTRRAGLAHPNSVTPKHPKPKTVATYPTVAAAHAMTVSAQPTSRHRSLRPSNVEAHPTSRRRTCDEPSQ
jgi:hypothetical protein